MTLIHNALGGNKQDKQNIRQIKVTQNIQVHTAAQPEERESSGVNQVEEGMGLIWILIHFCF